MTAENTQLERINDLIDKYLTSFGRARVAFYVFPCPERHSDFRKFLNTFISALNRAICRPVYSWTYDSSRGRYNMILIVSGYFRYDMNDITEAARRIWGTYSPFPIDFVAEMPMCSDSMPQDKTTIQKIMNEMQFTSSAPQRVLAPHQRAFACSKLY